MLHTQEVLGKARSSDRRCVDRRCVDGCVGLGRGLGAVGVAKGQGVLSEVMRCSRIDCADGGTTP